MTANSAARSWSQDENEKNIHTYIHTYSFGKYKFRRAIPRVETPKPKFG